MIPSSLRRAGLMFAAAGCLSLPISAQADSDADFAAALGRTPPAFAALDQLKAQDQIPATPQAPSAPDAVWQKVLDTVKKNGKFTPSNGLAPSTFTIDDSTGNPKAANSYHAITVVGMLNPAGKFVVWGLIIERGECKVDPESGNLRAEQWTFSVSVYGEIEIASFDTVTTAPDGKIISEVPEMMALSDPRISAQFDAMLKYWSERKP